MFRVSTESVKGSVRSAVESLAALLALLGLTACAGKAPALENSFAVVTARASLFENGPAQASGRDLELTPGETVAVLERSLGYSHVRTTEDVTGYVSNRSLRPAPAPQLASHFATPALLREADLPASPPASFNASDFGDVFPASRESAPRPAP